MNRPQQFSPWEEGRVDGDAARAYALATNDPAAAYLDGGVVPLMYGTTLAMPAMATTLFQGLGPDAIVGTERAAHAQHAVHFHRLYAPNTAIRWRCAVVAARDTPAGVVVTVRVEFADTHHNPIAEHSWDNIFVKGRLVRPDVAQLAPVDHGFPEFTGGNLVWTQVIPVSFDQGFRYAGVSGDRVAHAIDDEAARREGLPGKIVQGLCTYAMCTGAVVRNTADDDPGRLRRITARLSAPLRPGTDLTVNCFDAGRTDDGYRCVAFEAEAGGVTVLKHGRAAIN